MAHKKAGGSTALGRDSQSKRLGPKRHDGQFVKTGMVLVRQRGTKFWPGRGAAAGVDDTIFAMTPGVVRYTRKTKIRFDGSRKQVSVVSVVPSV